MRSAATIASQMPFMPIISGRIITAAIWNSSVLENEIAAETKPLLSAVKKDDAKILKPEIKKDIENSLKPLQVKSKSSLSYPTNIFESGDASSKADRHKRHLACNRCSRSISYNCFRSILYCKKEKI